MVNIVIAKYNENIEWVNKIKHKTTIYDKSNNPIENSIKLKNVGREAETFLYHIIKNYNKLDDVTIFLQGNPFEHLQILVGWRSELTEEERDFIIDKINNEITDFSDFSSFYQVLYNVPNFTNGANSKEYCNKYYGRNYDHFTVSPGAQYIVPKKYILSRPLSFWENLHKAMYSEDLDAYTQEQLWYLAFIHNMNFSYGDHDYEKAKCLSSYSINHSPYSYFNNS